MIDVDVDDIKIINLGIAAVWRRNIWTWTRRSYDDRY